MRRFFKKAESGATKFFRKAGEGTKQFGKGAGKLARTLGSGLASGAGEVGKVARTLEKVAAATPVLSAAAPALGLLARGASVAQTSGRLLKDVGKGDIKAAGREIQTAANIAKTMRPQKKQQNMM